MVVIVSSADVDARTKFINAVESALLRAESETERVAFDCEGVNLSRIGTIELISICFSTMEVYLVDFSKSSMSIGQNLVLESVKRLFESRKVIKIIHDCRMDSDALYHLHQITLVNVHDTSCFHAVITGQEDKNLNDVLAYNSLSSNVHRDKWIYKTNPRFWATRPITTTMIEWATSDVDKLFHLALKQLERVTTSSNATAIRKSDDYVSSARTMNIATNLRVSNVGQFIGSRGSNLRNLQNRTGTVIYQERPKDTWFVYYPNSNALDTVKRSMNSNSRSYGYDDY